MEDVVAILLLSLACIGYGLLFKGKSCAGCGGCKGACSTDKAQGERPSSR